MTSNLPVFEGDVPYTGLDSFNVLSKSPAILCSRVNIVKCSSPMVTLGMKEMSGFQQTIFIRRSVDRSSEHIVKRFFPYTLTYIMEDDKVIINFSEITEEKLNEKKNTISFLLSPDKQFSMEFRHKYDFLTVVKILEEKNKKHELLQKKQIWTEFGMSRKKITEDRVRIMNDIILNYSKKAARSVEQKGKKKGVVRSISSAGSTLQTENKEYYLPLVNTIPRHWGKLELLMWFQQIPVHDKENKRLLSLFDYISNQKLRLDFEEFFTRINTPFIELEKIVSKIITKGKVDVKDEEAEGEDDDDEENEPKKSDSFIRIIESKPIIIKRLHCHFNIMKYLSYEYRPSYYIVLRKHITHAYNSTVVQENPDVFDLERGEMNILIEKKYFWSIIALRRKIAFNFLFGMSIDDYTYLLLREFNNFEKGNKELKFLKKLELFNKHMGIGLEDLSLQTFLQKRCLLAKSEWTELKQERKRISNELSDLETKRNDSSRFEKAEKQVQDPTKTEKEKDVLRKRLKQVKDRIFGSIDKKSEKLNDQLRKIQVKEKDAMKKYLELNPAKINRNKERFHREKTNFKDREEYVAVCRKLIHEKLKRILEGGSSHGDIRLTSKLVLSRHQTKSIPFVEKYSMKVVRNILNPDFFRFGFIHGYVIVCNVGFHFFGSGIVYVEDIKNMSKMMEQYEDLVCLDSHSQLICSYERFFNFVTSISKTVIEWNSNYQYSFAGIRKFQTKYVRNCQEFALSLLHDCLKVPSPFYPRIKKYIDDLAFLHNKKMLLGTDDDDDNDEEEEENEGEEVSVYRYIRVTDDLPDEIKNGLCKGKSRKYFPTHKDLDLFVYDCLNVCEDLEVEYPGLYSLLKGFDRAFWVQKMYRMFPDETNDPGKISGKNICHFFRRDHVKNQ